MTYNLSSSPPLEAPASAPASIDFRRSLPPTPRALHAHLVRAFNDLAGLGDLGLLTHQSIPRGSEEDRAAGALWLKPRFEELLPTSRVIVTNGTQSAILMLLRRIVGTGGLLVAECLSYNPLRLLAQIAGARVQGLEIDSDGIVPESFEAACRVSRPTALYCNPTVQNPTTAIVPLERRIAIAEIARRHGVTIIEDDALGRLHTAAPKPFAAIAPELTWYVMTTTKCLTHGLRLAYLVAPSPDAANRVIGPIEHLSYWHPAPLLAAMTTRWVTSGAADQIASSIAHECAVREAAAREVFRGLDLATKPGSMHVWLNLPPHWSARAFMNEAEQRGVLLRSAELFAVDDRPAPNAVRLSLSTPSSLDEVRTGLEAVRAILENAPPAL